MAISPDFTSIYTQDFEINFLQCYPNGYLKYTDLCNVFQIVAGKHAELGGISFSDMQEFQQAWVLSNMLVEIHRLPRWKETVWVKTWIKSLENSRSIRCMEMYIGDEKIVGCETFWVVFSTNSRRPEPLALRHNHFEKHSQDATLKTFCKIDIQNDMQPIANHKVQLSDLDIVNHVNSAKYLEWCLDWTDYNLITKNRIKGFEMNYLKELALNDEVEIAQKKSDDSITFSITNSSKFNFALQLYLK